MKWESRMWGYLGIAVGFAVFGIVAIFNGPIEAKTMFYVAGVFALLGIYALIRVLTS